MARLFVDNLTVMDFSFLDVQRGLVGESWIVDIELAGDLDEQGMVFDFGHVKKQIKQLIDAQADHRLLVPATSPSCQTEIRGEDLVIEFALADGGLIQHQSPRQAVLLVQSDAIEASVVADDLERQLLRRLPDNVSSVRVTLRCETIESAYFHYSHGLQKHGGDCQRIAHGHRSRLEVSQSGKRNAELEVRWAKTLADSYLATEHHIVGSRDHNGIPHVSMAYAAAQGQFALCLPESAVFVVPCVTTIENIAHHLAEQITAQTGTETCVKAFEGVGKGAFGRAEP